MNNQPSPEPEYESVRLKNRDLEQKLKECEKENERLNKDLYSKTHQRDQLHSLAKDLEEALKAIDSLHTHIINCGYCLEELRHGTLPCDVRRLVVAYVTTKDKTLSRAKEMEVIE